LAVVVYPKRHSLGDMYRASRRLIVALTVGCIAGQLLRSSIANGLIGGKPMEENIYPGLAATPILWLLIGLLICYKVRWPFAVYVSVRTLGDPAERAAYWFWFAVLGWVTFVILVCAYAGDYWRSLGALFPLFILLLLQAKNKYVLESTSLRQCIFGITLVMM